MALTPEKLDTKRTQLVSRTATALDIPLSEAETLLSIPRKQSLRLNTLKERAETVRASLDALPITTEPTPWYEDGLYVTEGLELVRDSTFAQEGIVYIQNAASWLPVIALSALQGDTILDVCAAPGGKTSHIAQATNNQAEITANDNSRARLHRLQNNLARLGVENVTFTLHDATRLDRHFDEASFDKILLDAPCSGEGMMTLQDNKSFESWSVAHIKRLQQLQKRILVQSWNLLKPGGTLVYSTCTMAPEENEAVVDYLLRHNDDIEVSDLSSLKQQLSNSVSPVLTWNDKAYDSRLKNAIRLKPSPEIEAFFVIKLVKLS